MMANLQKIKPLLYARNGQLDRAQVSFACNLLNKSGVIALPTDTLYGLAAKADDSKALDKIYKIKGRDAAKPLSICIANLATISEVADIRETPMTLLRSLLPGPVTIVLKRSISLNRDFNPNVDTIGVRIPSHSFITALCNEVGPLALTSANKSGEKSPIVIEDFEDIWDELECVFDLGPVKIDIVKHSDVNPAIRTGSTVIDLTDDRTKHYRIIREGCALNRSINILTRFGYRKKP